MEMYSRKTNVLIDYQSLKSDEIVQRLSQGIHPDVLIAPSGALVNLGVRKMMLPLDKFISRNTPATNGILPNLYMREPNSNSVFAIPYEVVLANGKMYNRRKFAEAGLNPDSPPLFWNELYEVSAKMTRWAGNQPLQLGFDSFDWIKSSASFLLEAGGSFFSDDYRNVTFHNTIGIEAVNFAAELYQLTYPGLDSRTARKVWPSFRSPQADFTEERTAIYDTGLPISYIMNSVEKQNRRIKDELRYFITKHSPEVRPKVSVDVGGIGILQQATSVDLAWQFIQWFLSPEIMLLVTNQRMTFPSKIDVYEQQINQRPEYTKSWYDLLQYADPPKIGKVDVPSQLNWPELNDLIWQVYQGKASAESLKNLGYAWQKQTDQAWVKAGVR